MYNKIKKLKPLVITDPVLKDTITVDTTQGNDLFIVSIKEMKNTATMCIDRKQAFDLAVFLIQEFKLNIDLGRNPQLEAERYSQFNRKS